MAVSSKKAKKRKKGKKGKFPIPKISNFSLGLVSGMILVIIIGLGVFVFEIIDLPAKQTGAGAEKDCMSYLKFKEIKASLIPSGVPDIYGNELNVSFDQVQEAINTVALFGPTYGREDKKIILTGTDLERYINIASQTSCEYCCGVPALIKEDGTAACGCAHSIMMRGLTAYLIKNHPELSNDYILKEINKWKAAFFPKQTLSKKLQEMEESGESGIKELLEEFPEFLPQMVGGC